MADVIAHWLSCQQAAVNLQVLYEHLVAEHDYTAHLAPESGGAASGDGLDDFGYAP